ncbi:MAG: GHKL domain-containing protein [Chitinophagaceae bacterium]|nr:GHKL domain-containing protein [Chitinophagaceae bacterium]
MLRVKRLNTLFIIYWFLLTYIVAALIWWFIALNQQNEVMTNFKLNALNPVQKDFEKNKNNILKEKKRKTAQYIGEGGTFLLLILAGAVFVFRAARNQFLQSQQHQNFMMAITHELKTPIAVTKINLETLQKYKLEEVQEQRLITNSLQEANRLNDLCNNILLTSQIDAAGYVITNENINASKMVNLCVQDFINRFPNRNIKTHLQNNLFINGDKLLLHMALNNLLDNAIKYSDKESAILVTLSKNHKIKITIADEGRGIPEQEKKKIFNKYYRVGNEHTKGAKGTGLGLYLTKKIIQQHKGDITVTNNMPRGSIFEISIKATDEKTEV